AISDSQIEPALLARIQQEHQSYRNMELTKIKESISSESGSLSMDRLVSLYNETFTLPSLDYEEWIETVETPSLPDKGDVKVILETMQKPPLISVVMPVYNPEEVYLRACIDSVLEQSYPYWELCIADDKSPKEHVQRVLREYEAKDKRINVVYRQQNGHISAASNSALEIAKGDFV
ncbi:glycosyltransferase, partial [Escherichia coli]|uniref:glycosyltransferase n=2 Tax=Enterobacterales TaxID=91347 RepID=UPI00191B7702